MLCQAMTRRNGPHQPNGLEWREPTQARSRARVATILDSARDLALEDGHLDFKITQVAERAGVPIGSLYQFFPTRTALLARLFAREMEPIDALVQHGLDQVTCVEDILHGIGPLMKASFAHVKAEPGLLVIWSAPALDPALQAADFKNSQVNARRITERVLSLVETPVDEAAVWETSLLVCHLWGHAIRLAVLLEQSHPDNTILDHYSSMIEGHLQTILT